VPTSTPTKQFLPPSPNYLYLSHLHPISISNQPNNQPNNQIPYPNLTHNLTLFTSRHVPQAILLQASLELAVLDELAEWNESGL
jgi:hypothetical protein